MGETPCYVLHTLSCIPLCDPVEMATRPKKLMLSDRAQSDSVTNSKALLAGVHLPIDHPKSSGLGKSFLLLVVRTQEVSCVFFFF